LAHGTLAMVALRNGELPIAEQHARTACEILQPFPPYRLDIVALWSRILFLQGQDAAALQICEEMVQQIEALGLESYGLLDLYVALAEARHKVGSAEGARQIVERALLVLQRRADDIPDADMRATYLREIPENARLLELAAKWRIDTSEL